MNDTNPLDNDKLSPLLAQIVLTDDSRRLTITAADANQIRLEQAPEPAAVISADDRQLPTADASVGLIIWQQVARAAADLFPLAIACTRTLRPGGHLLLVDDLRPDDQRAARYIDAFERLRSPAYQRACADYEWRGLLLDAGLQITQAATYVEEQQLTSWAQGCDKAHLQELQIMLVQAPAAVADWMQPEFAGTDFARFSRHHIHLLAHKA